MLSNSLIRHKAAWFCALSYLIAISESKPSFPEQRMIPASLCVYSLCIISWTLPCSTCLIMLSLFMDNLYAAHSATAFWQEVFQNFGNNLLLQLSAPSLYDPLSANVSSALPWTLHETSTCKTVSTLSVPHSCILSCILSTS